MCQPPTAVLETLEAMGGLQVSPKEIEDTSGPSVVIKGVTQNARPRLIYYTVLAPCSQPLDEGVPWLTDARDGVIICSTVETPSYCVKEGCVPPLIVILRLIFRKKIPSVSAPPTRSHGGTFQCPTLP